jgi:hypothetical protein
VFPALQDHNLPVDSAGIIAVLDFYWIIDRAILA